MRILKLISLFFILLILAVPYIVQYGAEAFLEKEYKVSASIDNVRFNVLTGVVGIEGVHIYGEKDKSLHLGQFLIDVDLLSLFQKKIFVDSISLISLKTSIQENENSWNIGGLVIPLPAESNAEEVPEVNNESDGDFNWGIGLGKVSVRDLNLGVDTRQFKSDLRLALLELKDVRSWLPESDSSYVVKLLVNDAPISVEGSVRPFLPSIDVKTSINITELKVAPLIQAVEKDIPLSDLDAEVSTAIDVSFSQKADTKDIALSGSLDVANVKLTDPENGVTVTEENINWNGDVNVQMIDGKELPKIRSLSSVSVSPFTLKSAEHDLVLAAFESLNLEKINVSAIDSVKLEKVTLKKLVSLNDKSLKDAPKPLTLAEFQVSAINYSGDAVEIDSVTLNDLHSHTVIDLEGNIAGVDKLPGSQPAEVDEARVAEDDIEMQSEQTAEAESAEQVDVSDGVKSEEKPFAVKVNKFLLAGNNTIKFVDNSVTPVFDTDLNEIKLDVTNINTGDPEQWMLLDFSTGVGEYGKIKLAGKAQPFQPLLNANLDASIKNLALVPFSSYSGKYADLFIKRGSLNSKIKVNIVNDVLDVKNLVEFNKLKLEPGETEVSKSWISKLPMPLDLTLNVLRDKNDVIKIDIPVEGKVSDPDFRLQDVYNTAMKKALKVAATYYLTQAVQPLGLIMTASKLVGEAAKPGFEPLVFTAGSGEVSSDNQSHLANISKLMVERPKLSLTICGTAIEQDWLVVKESLSVEEKKLIGDPTKIPDLRKKRLLKLAETRGKAVKRFMVKSGKVDPGRLQECNGKIDEEKEAKPTVTLSL